MSVCLARDASRKIKEGSECQPACLPACLPGERVKTSIKSRVVSPSVLSLPSGSCKERCLSDEGMIVTACLLGKKLIMGRDIATYYSLWSTLLMTNNNCGIGLFCMSVEFDCLMSVEFDCLLCTLYIVNYFGSILHGGKQVKNVLNKWYWYWCTLGKNHTFPASSSANVLWQLPFQNDCNKPELGKGGSKMGGKMEAGWIEDSIM